MKKNNLLGCNSFYKACSGCLILFSVFFTQFIFASFSTDKDAAAVNSSINLTWSSSSSCTAYDDWSGSKSNSGTEAIVIGKSGWNIYSFHTREP